MKNADHRSGETMGSDIADRLKRFTESLESVEHVDDLPTQFTCHTIKLNLEPRRYEPPDVKEVREMLSASQAIFAMFLGVSLSTVQDWEQGVTPASGAACRLMDEIRRDTTYWLKRMRELSTPVGADT